MYKLERRTNTTVLQMLLVVFNSFACLYFNCVYYLHEIFAKIKSITLIMLIHLIFTNVRDLLSVVLDDDLLIYLICGVRTVEDNADPKTLLSQRNRVIYYKIRMIFNKIYTSATSFLQIFPIRPRSNYSSLKEDRRERIILHIISINFFL